MEKAESNDFFRNTHETPSQHNRSNFRIDFFSHFSLSNIGEPIDMNSLNHNYAMESDANDEHPGRIQFRYTPRVSFHDL